MNTYQRSRGQFSATDSLEFDDLEIRCTWSGLYEELANLRISLKVKCIPDTRLQLLNVRDPTLFFEDSFIERLPQTEHDVEFEDEADTPQSPLFGFSPLAGCGHDRADSPSRCESPSDASHISPAGSSMEETEEPYAGSESTHHDAELESESFVSPMCSAVANLDVSMPESPTASRKRSASDADLSDSELYDNSGVLKDVTNRKARQSSPVKSAGITDPATETTISDVLTLRDIAYPRSPNKPGPTRIPGLTMPSENVSPRKGGTVNSTKHPTTERLKLSTLSAPSSPKGKQPQKPSFIPKPTPTSHPEPSLSRNYAKTVVGFGIPTNNAPTADGASIELSRESRVRFQTPTSTTTETDSSGGQLLSPVRSPIESIEPGSPRGVNTPEPSGSGGDRESCYAPQNLRDLRRHQERTDAGEPNPTYKPEVYFVDGLIILDNSEKVQPGTFKVTITASFFLPFPPHDKGWSAIEISGLPRMGGGRSGFFLFLMPARHGLELRTTNVKRAKMVENCFIAEFVNARNLVIPLRRCDREFFGEITDFTVDQEIVAHSMLRTAANSSQSEQPFIRTRYHAMCSITPPNRCFWTETCAISLYLDGGPDGAFHCDLTSQKDGLKKINVSKEGTEMGVSRIHITCSPKDLERLCVSWVMKFPGLRAASWVPRVYSTSSGSRERSRDGLRYALLEVLNDPLYINSGVQVLELEGGIDTKHTRSYDHVENVQDAKGQPIRNFSNLSKFVRTIQLQIMRCTRFPNTLLKQALIVLCLAFLGFGIIKSARLTRNYPERSLVEIHLQATEPESEIPGFEKLEELPEGQEEIDDQGSLVSSMDIFNLHGGYTAVEAENAETRASAKTNKEQNMKSVNTGTEADTNADSTVSFRDRIDYWLGWTGPV
ncbi:hypothetical protein BDV12DRAFT_182603 [Aspergillus spectabilis]